MQRAENRGKKFESCQKLILNLANNAKNINTIYFISHEKIFNVNSSKTDNLKDIP